MAEQVPLNPIDEVKRLSYGHMRIDDLWGEFGRRGRGLRFTNSGRERVSHTIGWIMGISAVQPDQGVNLAKWFFHQLDWLSNYGGTIEGTQVPKYLVQMHDNGLLGSLSLAWYQAHDIHAQPDRPNPFKNERGEVVVESATNKIAHYNWHYAMNGGLILHGYSNATFSVRIGTDPNPWSVNT